MTKLAALLRRLPLPALCLSCALLTGCPGDPLEGTAGAPPHGLVHALAPGLAAAAPAEPDAQTGEAPAALALMPAPVATEVIAPRLMSVARVLPARASAERAPQQAAQAAQAQQAGREKTGAPAQPSAARVQQLINNAEASYNAGVGNYRAKHLEAARLDFDYAVDTLLAAGVDLKSPGPLADEFERLLDAINSLELLALKQGNGFNPTLDDAPLVDMADTTFAPNPELVARLKNQLNTTSDLPLVINDEVAGYIGVFSHSTVFRAHMAASLQRVGKYRGLIQQVLKEEGVPQDLIYLAVAESGFKPQVVNTRSGAGGMWQFMTYTGAEYGLTRNGFYDYRFDPEKSSRAYARYIKKLYGMFNDWYLSMAAYDWGPGAVQRAITRTGSSDYWELYRLRAMPAETRAYVPQILAAVIMAKNPEVYGLDKLVPSPPVIYDTVTTSYAIDLRLVADVTESSVGELVALNPALLRFTTPRDLNFDLHIPPGTKTLYADRLKDIPLDRRNSWRFHIVRPGETVSTIASALHANAADIDETNGITVADPMSPGDELVVPVQSAGSAGSPQRYTVQAGDTLLTVADRFSLSLEQLRKWNSLSSSDVSVGRTLYVAEPVRLAPASRARSRGRAGRGYGRASYGRRGSRGRSGGRSYSGRSSSGRSYGGRGASARGSSARGAGSRGARGSSSAGRRSSVGRASGGRAAAHSGSGRARAGSGGKSARRGRR